MEVEVEVIEIPRQLREFIWTFPVDRQEDAMQLVQNQLAYFQRCSKDPDLSWGHNGAQSWANTLELWGKDWVLRFLAALLVELKNLLLYDLVRFTIAKGPIHLMSFGKIVDPLKTRFEDVEIRMQPRQTKGPSHERLEGVHGPDKQRFIEEELWPIIMSETFQEFTRSFLEDMRSVAERNPVVDTIKEDLLKEIERQTVVMEENVSGPANRIIGSGELICDLPIKDPQWEEHSTGIFYAGRLNDRWEVYVDSFFPPDEVLLFRNAKPTGGAGFLVAFYLFNLHGHMGGLRTRSGKFLVRPEFYTLLKVA